MEHTARRKFELAVTFSTIVEGAELICDFMVDFKLLFRFANCLFNHAEGGFNCICDGVRYWIAEGL